MRTIRFLGTYLTCIALLAACSNPSAPAPGSAEEKVLNLYIWNDYLAPDTVSNFEKATGIKVSVSNFGSSEELSSKLAPGNSGYDIVVATGSFYEREIPSGYYQRLDKAKLPNLVNMDPQIQRRMSAHDPDNDYAVLHMMSTLGVGYNVADVKAAVGANAPIGSWALVFDPAVSKKLHKCGIALLDSASDMFTVTLFSIGRDPNSQLPADIEAAGAALMKIRPYIRYADTQRMISDLANGEICVAIGYSGDILQSRDRAKENQTGQEIAYYIPREGSNVAFDSYLIPKDAPHPGNANIFINYMLEPEVIAAVTNAVNYANGNAKAAPFVNREVLEDPGVYPPAQVRDKLVAELADSPETTRLQTRLWTRFMTGT